MEEAEFEMEENEEDDDYEHANVILRNNSSGSVVKEPSSVTMEMNMESPVRQESPGQPSSAVHGGGGSNAIYIHPGPHSNSSISQLSSATGEQPLLEQIQEESYQNMTTSPANSP